MLQGFFKGNAFLFVTIQISHKNEWPWKVKLKRNFFFKETNLIDNSQIKSRPKGPRNKRPPNAEKRRNNAEQTNSPIDENPPVVSNN